MRGWIGRPDCADAGGGKGGASDDVCDLRHGTRGNPEARRGGAKEKGRLSRETPGCSFHSASRCGLTAPPF